MIEKKWLFKALLVLVSMLLIVIGHSAWSIYIYRNNSTNMQADAAIVLGAAVWGNRPSPVFRERINHAIELYKNKSVPTLIFTGGQGAINEPAEASVAKHYALKQRVSEADILTETQSRTTEQNLYYAKQLATAHHLTTFLLVSDPLHMKRSILIARNMGMDTRPSPTPTTRYQSVNSQLRFLLRETYFYLLYRLYHPFGISG